MQTSIQRINLRFLFLIYQKQNCYTSGKEAVVESLEDWNTHSYFGHLFLFLIVVFKMLIF